MTVVGWGEEEYPGIYIDAHVNAWLVPLEIRENNLRLDITFRSCASIKKMAALFAMAQSKKLIKIIFLQHSPLPSFPMASKVTHDA